MSPDHARPWLFAALSRQPQDDVAVALASAPRARQAIDEGPWQPDAVLAVWCDLQRPDFGAWRKYRGNRRVSLGGHGDADHWLELVSQSPRGKGRLSGRPALLALIH
jgi:hypothetical protein